MPKPRRHELELRDRIKPHAERAHQAILEATQDAELHAHRVVDRMANQPPGLLLASRGGLLDASQKRLDNLGENLVRLVQHARVVFYTHSHELHKPTLDPEIHQIDIEPTEEGALAVRDGMIHGRSLQGDVMHSIELAKWSLRSTIQRALRIAWSKDRLLSTWRSSTANRFNMHVHGWLSDSSHAIHDAVRFALIKPEIRPKINA